jgi:hypothetical protein
MTPRIVVYFVNGVEVTREQFFAWCRCCGHRRPPGVPGPQREGNTAPPPFMQGPIERSKK